MLLGVLLGTAFGAVMDLGVRHIRTAGKGSGSVELTLPGALRQLVGLPCRIVLQDGAQPDIIVRPDLSPALAAFGDVWRALALVFAADRPCPGGEPFPAHGFSFGMATRGMEKAGPYLCWQDGLALATAAGPAAAAGAAAARATAACAAQLAPDLGIEAGLAADFGAVCGFYISGDIACADWQEACDIAASELAQSGLWRPGAAWRAHAGRIAAPALWADAGAGLVAIAHLFAAASQPGARYAALRRAWRRGRSIELQRG